jgi:hypothetical protein
MKKKGVAETRLFALWEKASKARKTDKTTTPNQNADASSASIVQSESNLQLALVQAPDAEQEPESSGGNSSNSLLLYYCSIDGYYRIMILSLIDCYFIEDFVIVVLSFCSPAKLLSILL